MSAPNSNRLVRSHLAGDPPVIAISTNTGAGPAITVDGADVIQVLADLFPDAPVSVDAESVTLAEDLFTALETLGLIEQTA